MSATTEARALLSTPDLIAVGVQGDDVRRRMHGARTTFLRVFEVHVDAPVATLPPRVSAGEFRIVGKPSAVDAAVNAVNAAAALANGVAVSGFSLAHLWALAPSLDELGSVCERLHKVGLDAIAEAPVDPDLVPELAAAVKVARQAGLAVERLTVEAQPPDGTAGIDARLALVERARRLQEDVGGFRVFAPLSRTMSVQAPTTGYADVRQIALARVVVTNVESIQVDWQLYGPKLAQVALTVGADDIDGVAAVDPGLLGTRRSPIEEIKNNIRAAGLDAAERDGRFRLLS